jgi:glucan-binding YG repeat protein
LREIENARSTDNKLYRVTDPTKPIKIDYTFALDMTAIEMPAQLEPLKSMLPDGTNPDAAAWDFLLSLAERICVQTNVTIRVELSPELDVDISELKVVTDYFELTSVNLDENNVLTMVCNWKDQTQAINPATANSLCLLTGIKATVKDSASYFNNEVVITNNGTVSYDIYLATSALHTFASDPANQAQYGLYPFEHSDEKYPNGCRVGDHDTGGHFSSQYLDFADIYVVNTEIRQGWQEEDGNYYFYRDNVAVTGTQLVTDRHDANKLRFYEFDEDGKLIDEQGANGLVWLGEDLFYAVLGEAQTGWQQIDGNNYYFHPDTGKALNGVQTIRERIFPDTSDPSTATYTYTFENFILVRGDLREETIYGNHGIRYRWAGDWKKGCWFEVDGNTYHVTKNYPFNVTTGYAPYIINYPNVEEYKTYLFDDKGVLQKDLVGPATVNDKGTVKTLFFKDGMPYPVYGLVQADDGYYYYVNNWDGTIVLNQEFEVTTNRSHGLVPAGTYTFDAYGRLTESMIADALINNGVSAKVTVVGRVLTVVHDIACKVMYKDADGKYHVIEAMINPYGAAMAALDEDAAVEYNFAIPKDATEVKIVVSGDVSGDGKITNEDVLFMIEAFRDPTKLTDEQMYVADVDGDGRITAADIAYINAVVKKGIELDW